MSFYRVERRGVADDLQPHFTPDNTFLSDNEGDLESAKRHGQANKIAFEDPQERPFLCTCCRRNIHRKDFPLNCDTDELGKFGLGYALYFKIIDKLNLLMFFFVIFHGMPSLLFNLFGETCKQYSQKIALALNLCVSSAFYSPSFANRVHEEKHHPIQVYIDTYTFYMLLFLVFYLRLKLYDETLELKDKVGLDINDFSIFVDNLPAMGTRRLQNLLIKYFKRLNYNNALNYEIKDVCMLYDTREYLLLKTKSKHLQDTINSFYEEEDIVALSFESDLEEGFMNLKQKAIHKRKQKEEELNNCRESIELIEMMIAKSEVIANEIFIRKAFITFKLFGAAHDLKNRYSEQYYSTIMWRRFWNTLRGAQGDGKNRLYFQGHEMRVMPAVHANNLNWENLALSTTEKMIRRSLIMMITFLLSIISVWVVSTIAKYQIFSRHNMLITMIKEGVRSMNFLLLQCTIISVSLVVVVVNQITIFMLSSTVEFEKHEKKTRMDSSLTMKLTIQYFVVSALIVLIVNWYYDNVWIYGGLISQVTFLYVTNFIVKTVLPIVDFGYHLKLIKQWYYMLKRYKISQKNLNVLFEFKNFDFAMMSAGSISQVYISLFFSSLVPFGSFFILLTQMAMYRVHKWIILRRCGATKKFGDDLTLQILNLIDYSLFFYAAGTTLVYKLMINKIPVIYYINLGVSIVYCFLPLSHITRKMVKVPGSLRYQKYSQYKDKFVRERYHLSNPVREATFNELGDLSPQQNQHTK